MAKQLVLQPEKCTNCRSCELICSFEHEGAFNPVLSNVTVFDFEESAVSVAVMCLQCDEAACANICPSGALAVEVDGFVSFNQSKCLGCKLCAQACPFGNIAYSPATKTMHKCDLCGGEPQCALWCSTGAITFVDPDEAPSRKKLVAEGLRNAVAEVAEEVA